MSALFTTNQATKPAGTLDRARRDIDIGTITVNCPSVHITYLWEIVSEPIGSTASISNPTLATTDMNLTIAGGHVIQLTVDKDKVTEDISARYIGIPLAESGLCIPAAWETFFDNSQSPHDGLRGAEDKLTAFFRYLDAGGGGGLFEEGTGANSTKRKDVGLTAAADYSYANGRDNIVTGLSIYSMALMGGDSGSSLHNIIGASALSPYSIAAGSELALDDGLNGLGYNYAFGKNVAVDGSFNTVFPASVGDPNSVAGVRNFAVTFNSSIEGERNLVHAEDSTIEGCVGVFAMGVNHTAGGENHYLLGENLIVDGECHFAHGLSHEIDGGFISVFGESNIVDGEHNLCGGVDNVCSGDASIFWCVESPDVGSYLSLIMGEVHDGLIAEFSFINGAEQFGEFRNSLVLGEGNEGDTADGCLISGDGHRIDGSTSVVIGSQNILWLNGEQTILNGLNNWMVKGEQNNIFGLDQRVVGAYKSMVGGEGNFVGGSGRVMSDPEDPRDNAEYSTWTPNSDIISGWKNDVHSWPGEDGGWSTPTGNVVSGEANAIFSQYSVCQGKLNKLGLGGGNIVVGENITIGNVPQLLEPGPTNRTYFGKHNGALGTGSLSDPTMNWTVNIWVDFVVINITDKSWGKITANTSTGLTATMADGDTDIWNWDDVYVIVQTDVAADPQGLLYTPAYSAIFGKDHVLDPYSRLNIVAGDNHTVKGFGHAVFGQDHTVTGDTGAIATYNLVSGLLNSLTNSHKNVVGGESNTLDLVTHNAIFGQSNVVIDNNGWNIISGKSNHIEEDCDYNAIFGQGNTMAAEVTWSLISGSSNSITEGCTYNYIFGQSIDVVDTNHWNIAGGADHYFEASEYSTALGQGHNVEEAFWCLSSGQGNDVEGGTTHSIVAGQNHVVDDSTHGAVFGQGGDLSECYHCFTSGLDNTIYDASCSTVLGYWNDLAGADYSLVVGFYNHLHNNANKSLTVGYNNDLSYSNQYVFGDDNVAPSGVPMSLLFGNNLMATWAGALVADYSGSRGATGMSQNAVSAGVSVATSDDVTPVWSEMFINGSSSQYNLYLRTNEAAGGRISVLAKRKDGTPSPGEVALWNIDYLVDRRSTGTVVDIIDGGSSVAPTVSTSTGQESTLRIKVSPMPVSQIGFIIEVLGAANEDWYWQAMLSGPQLCAQN